MKERTSWKHYNLRDVIDGSELHDLSGGNEYGKKGEMYMLVQRPLEDFEYYRQDLCDNHHGYDDVSIAKMKADFENTPPIPENGDGLHRIISANELGYETILVWERL